MTEIQEEPIRIDAPCTHERATPKSRFEKLGNGFEETRVIQCPDCGRFATALMPLGPVQSLQVMWAWNSPEAPQKDVKKKPDPSLARSRINRAGLKAGTAAPDFNLPTVAGDARVALADYRGRRVLLVFMHYACGPCDETAPHLQRLHESGFAVVAIGAHQDSEKDVAAMREKIAKSGLTFPVGAQHGLAVSKAYGTFAVPAAYVIDADGVLETDVIVGSEGIIPKVAELLGRPAE